ncbi:Protein RMD-6 [Aphelenchoides avenae]|nr:Protein RMD-6 [Aphelenchus avenae]
MYEKDGKQKKNVELLWRLGEACRIMGEEAGTKDKRRKELLTEGQKHAVAALKQNEKHFNATKTAALATGSLAELLPLSARLAQRCQFKVYLDKGLAMKPQDIELLHARGRLSYSVAHLGWLERTVVVTFYKRAPPVLTYDDAISDFLQVEKTIPAQWVDNLLWLAKAYLAKNDQKNAVKYLKQADALDPVDDAERESLAEVKKLLRKYAYKETVARDSSVKAKNPK